MSNILDISAVAARIRLSVHNVLEMANSRKEFFDYLQQMTNDVEEMEKSTRGQDNNTLWFEFRKVVITASKCHDILTKMTKVLKGGGGCIDMYSVNQKVTGLTYTNPNIPALKYGRDMEDEAANDFFSAMKLKHKKRKMIQCGLFLDKVSPVIGASPDCIFYCDCCPPACVEIK